MITRYILDYDVVTSESIPDLIFMVKEKIKSGWLPLEGGFCVISSDSYGVSYYQAVIKYSLDSGPEC